MTTFNDNFPGEQGQGENQLIPDGAPDVVADSDVAVLFKSNGTKLLTTNNHAKKNTDENNLVEAKDETRKTDHRHQLEGDAFLHLEVNKWNGMLILASAVCCLGSALPAGYNIGVMNNAAEIMQNFCNKSVKERYNINLNQKDLNFLWSTIVSIFLIGGVVGSLGSSHIANKFGRKGALCLGNIFGIIGSVVLFFVPILNSVELFLIGRIFVGLSGGLATSLVSTYMTEISPLKLRGSVGVLCQLGITCGVLLGQITSLETFLGNKNDWNLMLAAFGPLCLTALILTLTLPESPKYLFVIKEDRERALESLTCFRGVDRLFLRNEISELETELAKKSTDPSWTITRIFRDPALRLPLILVCLLQLGQQLSGINAVFYYSNVIFKTAELDTQTSQYATIGTGIINVAMAVISVKMMTLFRRKTLFMTSLYLTIFSLVIICISIAIEAQAALVKWICIIAVQAFVLFYGIGLGPIPFFIGSELFEAGPRSAAMSVGSVCNWGGNFIVGMTFTYMVQIIEHYSFLVFAALTLLLALFCSKYLPETQGKTTEEIAASVSHGFKSRPNSRHLV